MLRLIIKPYTLNDNDVHVLLSWINSQKELRQWAGPSIFHWPVTKKQLANYLTRVKPKNSRVYLYKAMTISMNMIGHFELDQINYVDKTTVLSRVIIAPEFRGQGLSREMVKFAVDVAFNSLHLQEVKLSVYNYNMPATHVYKSVGFKIVNTIKDPSKSETENWDCFDMALRKNE